MPVLSAIQSAALRVVGQRPDQIFASTGQIEVELADLANEVAADIAKSADWRDLTRIATITTTGAEAYDAPVGYDRMLLSAEVDDPTTWFWGYEPFDSVNEWMRYKSGSYSIISPGGWIILGGQFNFYPAPTGQASFPYITKLWATDAAGTPKAAFTSDDDEFLLDNRLLTLGLIWRYRSEKGLEYAEAMATYETAIAQAQTRDKGARVLKSPRPGAYDGRIAYSGRAIR